MVKLAMLDETFGPDFLHLMECMKFPPPELVGPSSIGFHSIYEESAWKRSALPQIVATQR